MLQSMEPQSIRHEQNAILNSIWQRETEAERLSNLQLVKAELGSEPRYSVSSALLQPHQMTILSGSRKYKSSISILFPVRSKGLHHRIR